MAKDNHQRYCNCHAPDPKRGYCQSCGEKAWPVHTQYEKLREQFDREYAARGPVEVFSEEAKAAKSRAMADARLYGMGFYRVHPNGYVEYIPFDQMHIERGPVRARSAGESNGK